MSDKLREKIAEITDSKNLQLRLVDAVKKISDKQEEINKLTDKIDILTKEYELKIKSLEVELKKLKTSKTLFSDIKDKESKQRLILMLRARQFNKRAILKHIESNSIDGIDEELVEYTINNIKTLSPELEAYFLEQQTIFNEKVKVNTSYIKKIIEDTLIDSLDDINYFIAQEKEKPEPDVQLIKQLIAERKDIASKFNGLLGNLVEEEKEAPIVNLEIQKLKDDIDRKSENIVKFNLDGITIISNEDDIN